MCRWTHGSSAASSWSTTGPRLHSERSANAAAVTLLRRHMLRAMEHLGAQIAAQDARAIAEFRRLHASALLVNLLQVVLIVWGILQLSQQFR